MIISRTPLRISFLGGGSDSPACYSHGGGAVISTAIDKYIYITVNPKFDQQIRASYSITEIVDNPRELKHELIRSVLELLQRDGGLEITSISDIPSLGTGLGSSSCYTVGLLNALHAMGGRHASAERLAQEACKIEIEMCSKPIGKQDQYIAAYGGLQLIRFNPDGSVFVDPIVMDLDAKRELESRLLLLYTGTTRSASDILAEQKRNTESEAETRSILDELVALVCELRGALERNDLDAFGPLLHAGWVRKRELAHGITTPQIDEWYATALKAGATGGKILGAGGGGFLLLYAPRERHPAIVSAVPALRCIPFRFEQQGSKIVYIEERHD